MNRVGIVKEHDLLNLLLNLFGKYIQRCTQTVRVSILTIYDHDHLSRLIHKIIDTANSKLTFIRDFSQI